MNQQNTQPLYQIVKNIDDFVGYKGQPVKIKGTHEDNYFTVMDSNGNEWYCGEEELQEIKTDTQPLYKVLDSKRTQNKWIYTDEFGIEVYDETSNVIADFYQSHDDYISEETKKANAEYTALAVNNLANVADALDRLAKWVTLNTDAIPMELIKAKEALKAIS